MSISKGVVASMEIAMKAAMGDLFELQQVDLYGGGTVEVKLHIGTRRANESDLTSGASQDTQLIATIDADDWNTKAGRPPQKGDVIWWTGRRHAVDRSIVAAPAGNQVFYKARVQG